MNELKHEDVMRALECCGVYYNCNGCPYYHGEPEEDCHYKMMKAALALLRENRSQISVLKKLLDRCETQFSEKDAEIERLTQERDDARRDCAVAEQNHYECKKELEEMSDDILDSVRAERDRYKAESEQYQREMLKRGEEIEKQKALKKIATDNNHQCYGLGYEDGIKAFAEKIKTFYHNLSGKTVGGSVEYHIDQIAKEMKEERE